MSGKDLQLPELIDALGALTTPGRPSGPDLSRIKNRITRALETKTEESDLVIDTSTWGETFDQIVEGFEDAPTKTQAEPEKAGKVRYRRLTAVAAVGLSIALLTTALASASTRARPGGTLYPIKLRVEALRLSLAISAVSKAERLNTIFADRLGFLADMDPASRYLPEVTGTLNGAGTASLRIIEGLKVSDARTRLAANLNGLARTEATLIADLMTLAPIGNQNALTASYTVASMIIVSTGRILRPVRYNSEGDADAHSSLVAGSLDAIAGAEPGREPTASGRQSSHAVPSPNSEAPKTHDTPSASDGGEPPPSTDTDRECDASAGTVCLRVPVLTIPEVL